MADDDEDDYLSDKFLAQSSSSSISKNLTYAELRKQARKQADLRNEKNKVKSRRQLEQEAREEGLRKSLFERAVEEKEQIGVENKAMAMMMKMGFKPGQSLGKSDSSDYQNLTTSELNNDFEVREEKEVDNSKLGHRKEPLPIDVWVGKKGLGLGKRSAPPDEIERAKKAKILVNDSNQDAFRTRARYEYEERRAEGRLVNAQKTLLTLDEKAGEPFNIFSLNPHDPDTFPGVLLSTLSEYASEYVRDGYESSEAARLRQQMSRDALEPINADPTVDDVFSSQEVEHTNNIFSEEMLKKAKQFVTLSAQERLNMLLSYLRQRYFYCFWCGTQYSDENDLENNCPGEGEDAHD